MKFLVWMQALALVVLGGCGMLLSAWVRMPWAAIVGLALFYASVLLIVVIQQPTARHAACILSWASSVLVCAALVCGKGPFTLDNYYAVLAGMNAVATFPAMRTFAGGKSESCGRSLLLLWASLGASVWIAVSYLQNWSGKFFLGLGFMLAILILCLRFFPPGRLGLQVVATLILLIVGLPVADVIYRPAYRSGHSVELAKEYYSFTAAKKDPDAFARSWRSYLQEWDSMGAAVFEPAPQGKRPFRLRPNSRGKLFESTIAINDKGFRGNAIPDEKGDAYRIVALGESTTFGCTLRQDDRPWPEVLERLIREQLKPRRAVQVINAGVPAYNLRHNLQRLRDEILALKPDLILSYHGINGFHLLDDALPRTSGPPPPAFRARPLRLLADCEYRLKMLAFRRRKTAKLILRAPELSEPLKTDYARAYRELINICRTNGIRLAIGNFSLAVNSRSGLDVAEFYRTAAPAVHWVVRANAAHTVLVKKLAEESPEVVLVDTHPHLDGHPEMFIDLGHMTQAGRQQIAENFLNGIRGILETDLANPGTH